MLNNIEKMASFSFCFFSEGIFLANLQKYIISIKKNTLGQMSGATHIPAWCKVMQGGSIWK